MSEGTYLHLAQAILIAHQRRNTTSCICGWAELGHSHAKHVAEVLDQAGALRTTPPSATDRLRDERDAHTRWAEYVSAKEDRLRDALYKIAYYADGRHSESPLMRIARAALDDEDGDR